MAMASINVWGKDLREGGADSDLSGGTYLYIPGTAFTWIHIIPSEKLSAALCLLKPSNKRVDDVKCYKLEADLVMGLGFKISPR